MGVVGAKGRALHVFDFQHGWTLEIRSAEAKTENSFYKHHERDVTAADIRTFIPSVDIAEWQLHGAHQQVADNDENFLCAAMDGYEVRIYASNCTPDAALKAFIFFMAT
jgi:hypothetical protein